MRRHSPIRLLICAAIAGSASVAAAAVPGGIASAAPLHLSCTSLSGSATSQTISGCTGTGAIAADAGTPPAHGVSTGATTSTVKWSNGKTTIMTQTHKVVTPNACVAPAGYTKVSEFLGTDKVTGGTATGLIGSTGGGKICLFKKTVGGTLLVKNLGPFTI